MENVVDLDGGRELQPLGDRVDTGDNRVGPDIARGEFGRVHMQPGVPGG